MPLLRATSGRPMLSRGGRPLLSGASNVAAVPLPVDAGADVAAAQAFVAPLVLGINVERLRGTYMSYNSHPLLTDTDYWVYLKSLGFTHVRIFLPWRTEINMAKNWVAGVEPLDADLSQFLDLAETIIRGGLKVLYECTDYLGADLQKYPAAVNSVIDRQAALIAARGTTRFPPSMIAVGPFAGIELEQNADVNGYRADAHRRLRAKLPGYVLMTGAASRFAPNSLTGPDWTMVSDRRVILTVHDYPGVPTASYLQAQTAAYATLSAANGGVPVLLTEAAQGSQTYSVSWSQFLSAYPDNQPLTRPCLWAVTDGAWYPWNVSATNPAIQTTAAAWITRVAAQIQNTQGWLAQNPGVTPPAIPDPPGTTAGGGSGGGGTVGGGAGATFVEGFDNNNGGGLNHTWGNLSAVSYSGGVLRIAHVGGTPDEGAAGVMQFPGGYDWGQSYGLYEIRARWLTDQQPGPCVGLWAADNSWPRGEEDMGEVDGYGWYCSHHYDSGNGGNGQVLFYYRNAFPSRGDLDYWNFHVVGCLIKPGYLEYFVDGESIGSTTTVVTPMARDGGVNRIFFLMYRGWGGEAVEVDWCRFTPL